MKLPVVHLERTVNGAREKRTINTTAYARDIAKWGRKGFKLISEYTPPGTPDAVVDFARRQDEKEMAREANPKHEARHDAERRYEHQQGRPEVALDATDPAPAPQPEAAPKRKAGRPTNAEIQRRKAAATQT